MFGDVWDVHASRMDIQRNFEPGPLMPHADLIGNYRSGMMDYRETEGHKYWLKQQDAAFNSPTGLNSHREMYFGELVLTPITQTVPKTMSYAERMETIMQDVEELNKRSKRESDEYWKRFFQATGHKLITDLSSTTGQNINTPKPSWSPTIDYGNGLWEKQNKGRGESLIGYKPYGTHTHTGPDFISMKNEETGRHLRWDLNPLTGKPF